MNVEIGRGPDGYKNRNHFCRTCHRLFRKWHRVRLASFGGTSWGRRKISRRSIVIRDVAWYLAVPMLVGHSLRSRRTPRNAMTNRGPHLAGTGAPSRIMVDREPPSGVGGLILSSRVPRDSWKASDTFWCCSSFPRCRYSYSKMPLVLSAAEIRRRKTRLFPFRMISRGAWWPFRRKDASEDDLRT